MATRTGDEFERNMNELIAIQNKANTEARKKVVAANGSCLTCKHTKVALGMRLICKAKDKLVSQYNYCERYISVNEIKKSGESE
jgi:hypothetical protein